MRSTQIEDAMSVSEEIQAFPAPAKLNLDLRITGRRSDGYHNLESIFCLIGLYDTVHLKMRTDGQIILHTPVEGLEPEQDLTYRAAKLCCHMQTYRTVLKFGWIK